MMDWLELPSDDGPEADLTESVRCRSPAEELFSRGDERYFEGDFAAAAEAYGRARQHDPTLFLAWALQTEALVRGDRLGEADARSAEALQTYGQVPLFYAARAVVLAHQGESRAAFEHSDISVRGHEASVFTWLARGEVVLAASLTRELHGVEACFEKAAARDPTGWQAPFRAGLILLDWGHADAARERLAALAAPAGERPFLWKLIGDCHRQLGRPLLAREHYERALARRPGYRPARQALRSLSFWGRLWNRVMRFVLRGGGR